MNVTVKRELKRHLYSYPHDKAEVANELADLYSKGLSANYSGQPGAGGNSGIDTALSQFMSSPRYLWCVAIESALRDFESDCKLISMKFFGQKASEVEITLKTRYSRALVYVRLNEFYDQLHKYAIKYGLMDVN